MASRGHRGPGVDGRRSSEPSRTRLPGRARRVHPRCAAYRRGQAHRDDRRGRPARFGHARSRWTPVTAAHDGVRPSQGTSPFIAAPASTSSLPGGLPLRRGSPAAAPGRTRRCETPIRHALGLAGCCSPPRPSWAASAGSPVCRTSGCSRQNHRRPRCTELPGREQHRLPSLRRPRPRAKYPPAPPPPPGLGGFRSVQELDAAFEAFYVPPPGCADPDSHADIVACANHRIRARKGYMAAGTPTEPELVPEAQEGGRGLAWDDEAAINALVPPHPDQADPDAAQWRLRRRPEPPGGGLGRPQAGGERPGSHLRSLRSQGPLERALTRRQVTRAGRLRATGAQPRASARYSSISATPSARPR